MSHDKDSGTKLTTAAEALEAELRRYEELAVSLEREHLDSEKNLRRAAQALGALHDSDTRLSAHVGALLAAIAAARERQQAHADSVQQSAERIRQRSETLMALLARWEALGRAATEINQLVQRAAGEARDSNGTERKPELGTAFQEVDDRLTGLAEEAQNLATTAAAEHFPDLTRQAEGLRAQVLAARNKLRLARNSG